MRIKLYTQMFLATLLWITVGCAPAAFAATINASGSCTIVDAARAANSDAPVGGCSAGSGADTIVLSPNTIYTITEEDSPESGNGLPFIDTEITFQGNNSIIRRAPNAPRFHILHVGPGGDVTVVGTTITGGLEAREAVSFLMGMQKARRG